MSAGITGLLERINFRDEGEPPEADVAAALSELDQDPEPGRKTPARRGRRTTTRRPAAGGGQPKQRTAAQVRKDLTDELEMYAKMGALAYSVRCQQCAGPLDAQSRAIAESLAAMIARSEWLLAQVSRTTLLADIFKLLHALYPFGRALFDHGSHVHEHDQAEGGTGGTDWNAYDRYQPYRPE